MSYQCKLCTATFTLKHNLKRHETKRCKNASQNVNIHTQNVNPNEQNVNMNVQNVNMTEQNVNMLSCDYDESFKYIGEQLMQCVKCEKKLSSRSCKRHMLSCKGVRNNTCFYCKRAFKFRQSLSRHQNTCKERYAKNKEVKQTVPCTIINNNDNRIVNDSSTITNNITHINNTNNITIQLNVHGKENYDALLDTIRTRYPQAFVTMVEEGDTASLLKLVHFNKDFPENQTIRKPIKKDVSAEIHIGEGRWERRPTQEVIETFKGQTGKRLCNSLQTNMTTTDKRNDMYLKEILYEQSKEPSGNTESLLLPFVMNEQEIAEKELVKGVHKLRMELSEEYSSLIGTKMFVNQWKRESRPLIHAFEDKWNTVFDNIKWV